jgi:hypothetical protein
MTRWRELWRRGVSDYLCISRVVEEAGEGWVDCGIRTHLNSGSWPRFECGVAGEVDAGVGETVRKPRLCACLACQKLQIPRSQRGHFTTEKKAKTISLLHFYRCIHYALPNDIAQVLRWLRSWVRNLEVLLADRRMKTYKNLSL